MSKDPKEQRKLTPAERRRMDRYEETRARLEAEGYRVRPLTIGITYANVMALVLGLPIIAVLGAGFLWRNLAPVLEFHPLGLMALGLVFLLLAPVHELIHGVTWAIFSPGHWRSISFGFIARYLTPYCNCNEPLSRGQYLVGAAMPTLLLGVLPALVSIATGSLPLFLTGALMILGGGGDLTIILKLLRFKSPGPETIYLDHPCECGLVAFTP